MAKNITDKDIILQMGIELNCNCTFYHHKKDWAKGMCGLVGQDAYLGDDHIGIHALVRNQQVIALEFYSYNMLWIPESIGKLYTLEELYIDGVKMTSLPSSIITLSKLETLKISGCSNFANFPDDIGYLSALRTIDVSYCHTIKELPEAIGKLFNLKHLSCFYCVNLCKLPQAIGNLAVLDYLDISYSNITELPEAITKLVNLNYLGVVGLTTSRQPDAAPIIIPQELKERIRYHE